MAALKFLVQEQASVSSKIIKSNISQGHVGCDLKNVCVGCGALETNFTAEFKNFIHV